MPNNKYGLVFNPQSLSCSSAEAKELIKKLQGAGFIGDEFGIEDYQANLVGENFLKMITFLGCSPQIELTPPDKDNWHNFCHIQCQYFQQPVYYKGMKRVRCSCSQCGARITEPLPDLNHWQPAQQMIRCSKCQEKRPVEQLNWRHGAGFGQFFISIHNIYPNEAVPSEQLMTLLNSFQGGWNYFYYEI